MVGMQAVEATPLQVLAVLAATDPASIPSLTATLRHLFRCRRPHMPIPMFARRPRQQNALLLHGQSCIPHLPLLSRLCEQLMWLSIRSGLRIILQTLADAICILEKVHPV